MKSWLGRSLVALVVLAVAVPPLGATSSPSDPCPGYAVRPTLGPSCPVNGGYDVLLKDGRRVFTHGPDPAPASLPEAQARLTPYCVINPTPSTYHHVAIYAVAHDRVDRYATHEQFVRDMVADMNGYLRGEADTYFGAWIDYRFLCDAPGHVVVKHAVLPTNWQSTGFGTVVDDLEAQGYSKGNEKYAIWYDGPDATGGSAGTGTVNSDDRLIVDNANNVGPDWGVTWGYGWSVMMHENGHNVGAVQSSSPWSSGAFHCNDGQDIMCYSDGGPSSRYDPTVCLGHTYYDCKFNDYFNPDPESGNYLSDHWNIANAINRFVQWGPDVRPPTTTLIGTGDVGQEPWWRSDVQVRLRAVDHVSRVAGTQYRVDGGAWMAYTAPFTLTAEGLHAVEMYSTDNAGNVEPVKTASVNIDRTAPTLANTAPNGCAYVGGSCNAVLPSGAAVGGGQASIQVVSTANDDLSPIKVTALVQGPDSLVPVCSDGPRAAGTFSCTWTRGANVAAVLHVVASDLAGNTAEVVVAVAP